MHFKFFRLEKSNAGQNPIRESVNPVFQISFAVIAHRTQYHAMQIRRQGAFLLLLATRLTQANSTMDHVACANSLPETQCHQLAETHGCAFVQSPGSANFSGLVAHYCRATCGQCNVTYTKRREYDLQDYALRKLYAVTGGPDWQDSFGWLDPTVKHCWWRGVSCSAAGDVNFL